MKLQVELLRPLSRMPQYAKDLDVGADLFLPEDIQIHEGANKIPLGVAVHIPNGYIGFVLPRSGISSRYPMSVLPVPIDPSYTGEIHAIVQSQFEADFCAGDRIAQLVILPAIRAQFVTDVLGKRGDAGFGSTGGVNGN